MGVCNCSMFCCMLLYVHSSIAIILMGKWGLVALLNLSSWCLVMVKRLFLAVPLGCLRFVIVVFPDHTHLLFLSRNRHNVWSPTHWRAIKEESKVANRGWVEHQACSLLQYINVIANLFIIGSYFIKLSWKIMRDNNLIQFIHQVTTEFRFGKSLAQERFKSNLEFRYQIIVSSIKLENVLRSFWHK